MSSQSSMTTSRNQSTDTDEKCLMGPDTGSTTCSSYTTVSGRRTSQKSFAKLSSFINVTQIYEGTKTFSRDRIKVHLIMFEHKFVSPNGQSPCIEVVSYVYDDVGSSVPRLFLSADKIFGRLRGTLNVKGSRHTQESVVSYM